MKPKYLQINLSPNTREEMEHRAAETNALNLSEYVRRLIAADLEKGKKEKREAAK